MQPRIKILFIGIVTFYLIICSLGVIPSFLNFNIPNGWNCRRIRSISEEAAPHYQTSQPVEDVSDGFILDALLVTELDIASHWSEIQSLYKKMVLERFGNNSNLAKSFFTNYINHLNELGVRGADVVTAIANVGQYVTANIISSIDVETAHLYASTMYRIDQAFKSVVSRHHSNRGLLNQYVDQLIVIKRQLNALANQALALYTQGPRAPSNIPSSIRELHQAIAYRALQEVNMMAILLNPENMTLGTNGKILFKKFEYNGETFTVTIQQNGSDQSRQARTNVSIERENGGYVESAKDFAQEHGLSWDLFIDYVERNLTHATGRAANFSFRIDLDSIQGRPAAVLDITSPYICTMLALFGHAGEYHTPLFGVRSEADFYAKTGELLGIFGLR